jgi:hypothetical protein
VLCGLTLRSPRCRSVFRDESTDAEAAQVYDDVRHLFAISQELREDCILVLSYYRS